MIVRVFLVLFIVLLGNAAAAETYLRGQGFATMPTNWRQSSVAQFYGYERTRITGGTGAAGGLFLPGPGFNFYGDLFLGGSLQRGTSIYAQGNLALKRASAEPPYVTTTYIGHFGLPVGSFIDTVGLALIGDGSAFIHAAAIVEFSNGNAYVGNWVSLPIGRGFVEWDYSWNPSGGRGYGDLVVRIGNLVSSLNVPASAGSSNFALNAFGLFQPPFARANSNSFLWAYAGKLAYTANKGQPPRLHVRGPTRIPSSAVGARYRGTSSASEGYRVRSVRYRIKHNGRTSVFRTVKGKANWSADIRMPRGVSRIEFVATTDAGRSRRVERRVVRN